MRTGVRLVSGNDRHIDTEPVRDVRSYGRRRGRKLSPRQRHLFDVLYPQHAAATIQAGELGLADGIAKVQRPVWLEIGFGGGEHMLWQADRNRDVTLIGCEPFIDGVVKVLSDMAERSDTARPLDNIYLFNDDARLLIRRLPDQCLARVFILFPDPWPKRRHAKRRLISPEFLSDLARVMQPDAELRVATDIDDYARTILLNVSASKQFAWPARRARDWTQRPADWPPTRYEAKAVREGRASSYFRFRRRT